jgi:hypothetical protein
MPKKLPAKESLLRILHRRELTPEIEEKVIGQRKQGYELLLKCLEQNELSKHQVANVCVLLMKTRFYGDQNQLLEVLLGSCEDTRIHVRSAAVRTVLALTHFALSYPKQAPAKATREYIAPKLNKSLQLGLEKPTEDWLKKFLG